MPQNTAMNVTIDLLVSYKTSGVKWLKDDSICFSDNSVQEQPIKELVRKYIRCSSRLTIAQVKKFLKVKLDLRTADQVRQRGIVFELNVENSFQETTDFICTYSV